MTNQSWPRGSQWRKWDLHVHSPASYGFKGDFNQFIIQLGGSTCDVIGINDYFSVAGYREVRRRLGSDGVGDGNTSYQKALEALRLKTLLPVVECRMNNVLVNKKGQGQRINFHLIFDPDLDPENIETLLKAQNAPDGAIVGQRYNDTAFLMNDVSVDFKTVVEAVHSGEFAGRVLVWLPYDEYGGIDGIDPHTDKLFKANLVRTADILGSSNKKQRDFFLWKDANFAEAEYRQWFARRKACIKGSDSHSVDEEIGALKDHDSKPTDKFCWIKADPTFEGLRQITNEPEDRVHIGRMPPKLAEVHAHPTRFIESIRIGKADAAETGEAWFECDMPINADMVAIIGNKGSGKSAFADILAVAGNAHCKEADLSFLNAQRFCQKNGRLAKNFEATVVWADGSTRTIGLHKKPDLNDVELIRYIPQSYLEKVCTETDPGQQSQFQVELRKVIFSHIGEADALGKASLDELIAYRTEELQTQISVSRRELSRINGEITRLEAKITTDHIAQLEAKLRHKQQELSAHQGIKPAPVERPDTVAPEQQAVLDGVSGKLAAEREAVAALDAQIIASQASQRTAAEQIAALRKIEGKIDNFAAEYASLERETSADLEKVGLVFASIVNVAIDKSALDVLRKTLRAQKDQADADLSAETPTGPVALKAAAITRIAALQDQLDAPTKRYETYNEALKQWETIAAGIVGDAEMMESLKWCEAQLDHARTSIPTEIEVLKGQRQEAAKVVHRGIAAIRDVYKELFAAVQKLISEAVIVREGFKLSFESSIIERAFQPRFFDQYVSQGAVGSFYGRDAGGAVMETLRADCDFDDVDQCIAFAEAVLEHLRVDMRVTARTPTGVAAQLRKNVDVKSFYDFIWGFEYLEPEYSLRFDGKDLSLLSPGERGTLLLIFYLLVDKSNTPIIVDQPEENLDSQTVFKLLIPVIKEVKRRRQIIMVTHSPNIAVVCDAEQIIHSRIDRAAGNKVIYTPGAIEAPDINRYLVDVLEGTRPAFENRDSKYFSGA